MSHLTDEFCENETLSKPDEEENNMNKITKMSEETKHRRGGRRPGRKPAKVDAKTRLERSRQSARECRARKKLRYQYLEELVVNKEQAVYALRDELEQSKQWCIQLDAGIIPQDLVEIVRKEEEKKELQASKKKIKVVYDQEGNKKEMDMTTSDSDSSKEERHFKAPQMLTHERRRSSQGSGEKQSNGSPQAGPSGLCASFNGKRDGIRLSRSDSDGSAVGIENIDFLDMISDDNGGTCHGFTLEDLKATVFEDMKKPILGASNELPVCQDDNSTITSQSVCYSDSGLASGDKVTDIKPYITTEVITSVLNTESHPSIPTIITSPLYTKTVTPVTSDHIYAFAGNLPSFVKSFDDS